jgi:farnesol dehydrogenase
MAAYLGTSANGNDRFSLCHIDDVVVGHLTAINVGKIGERYLLCGENISLTHIFNLAASLTNTAPPKFQLPYWLLVCAGRLCELWSSFGAWSGISHQTPFITSHSVEISKHQWAYSSEKAERELSYKSQPFEEGLLELLTWLRTTGKIKF